VLGTRYDLVAMLALTVAACLVVLIGAGVLWLKPWINDDNEISG